MPAFMNDDEQRKAHYQLQGTNQKCFHVYYLQITNYKLFLRILPAHKLGSDSSCFFVGRYIVLITRIRHESGLLHCFLYHITHAEKADAVFQERGDHHLVGGIDNTRHISAPIHRFVSQRGVVRKSGWYILQSRAVQKKR